MHTIVLRQRRRAPLGVLVLLAPFWVLYVAWWVLVQTLVLSVRVAIWACASLRFPQGVDTVGEKHPG